MALCPPSGVDATREGCCRVRLHRMQVMTRRELEANGMRRRAIERALREGDLTRIREGVYVDGTDAEVIAAVRCGGTVSCGAALRRAGVWVARRGLHVRVDPDTRVHGRATRIHRVSGVASDGVDTVLTALRIACDCMPRDEAVCAIDSVLNRGLASLSSLTAELQSSRAREALERADGRSESGIETLTRLRLRRRGIRLRTQVAIGGVGRVDLLIGDRLVIELDGDAWHSSAEQREADRRRDSALVAKGYLVLRAGYLRVMDDWPAFEAEVLAVVRRRDHRWRAAHRGGHVVH